MQRSILTSVVSTCHHNSQQHNNNNNNNNDEGKAIPLQAWTVPDGSRSLSLPEFKQIGI
jgi:hypothetical protein